MRPPYASLLFFALSLLLLSCQPTRRLSEGEVWYKEARVKYQGQPPRGVKGELLPLAEPEPNSRLLGIPFKLTIYNIFANKEKGVGKWLKEKLGEPPVLYQPQLAERSSLLMEKYLKDNGYLQASVSYDTLARPRRAIVRFSVHTGARYFIQQVDWPADSSPLHAFLREQKEESRLQPGLAYQLSLLKEERQRLAQAGLGNGFFGLSPDIFYYHLDTTLGQHQVALFPRIATEEQEHLLYPHYIGNTTVHATYLLDEIDGQRQFDTLQAGSFRFIQSEDFVRRKVLRRNILQDEGSLFRNSLQQRSVNRLLGLGPYKFVNLKYRLREAEDSLFLDREFFLTPALTQDFSAELEASTLSSSSNFLGSALNLNYTHRNFLGGAERFQLSFSSGIETQLERDVSFIRNFNLSLEAKLSIPNFVVPFGLFRAEKAWQARSVALLGGDFQRRTGFFSLSSFRGEFGYEWQPGRFHSHQLYPLQLTQVNLLDATEEFLQTVNQNPRLQESYTDYFIAGATYQYNYSEQRPGARHDYLFAKARVEPAGNLAYGLYSLLRPAQKESYELLGLPFAQFFRVEGDGRYHHYREKSDWIVRANLGLAYPYGNSRTVPFVRQFFVGGSNSIRAWQIRTLGPGTSDAGIQDTTAYNDQTGDIKLELNAEYRFPIYSYLKGALFVDAGNIWLLEKGPERAEEGVFDWNNFYREIAVGTGVGLRLDITYFVLRLDVAFPLRKPYLEGGPAWVFDEIALGAPGWRRENLAFNLALGYPF